MEENKPVETPVAGTEKPAEAEKTDSTILDALSIVEESDKALAAAETKIVSLKRKLKGTVEEGNTEEANELRAEIDSLKEKITALETAKIQDDDKELSEIQSVRKRNAELITALRARTSLTSDSGGGGNQDKLRPAEDLSTSLNREQIALYQTIADRRGFTLDQVLKAKSESERQGIALIDYLKKIKK